MDKKIIRDDVTAFWKKTGFGSSEHCFPAWYLCQKYKTTESVAMRQSSDGNYDFGMDAYYLDRGEDQRPKLVIIQAKFSDSLGEVIKGFKDLQRVIPKIKDALDSIEPTIPIENKVLTNLRGDVNRLDSKALDKLGFEFVVIHLCDEEKDVILNRTRKSRDELLGALEDVFSESEIVEIGPQDMGVIHRPPDAIYLPLSLESVTLIRGDGHERAQMYYGIGRLHELVEIYKQRRDSLFEKNVRYFINSKKNVSGEGPSAKMQETLERICVKAEDEPASFALYHNGITVFAQDVREVSSGRIEVKEPYVLNGCQTIRTAFNFRYISYGKKENLINKKWQEVSVPLRIITTRDPEMVRTITANNNRQNPISPIALRANESEQLELELKFRDKGIFYERQEGAFADLKSRKPQILAEEYKHTANRCVKIEELARAITATSGDLNLAHHSSRIFESNKYYGSCFSKKHLSSVVFLTFLQNLHDVIFVVLHSDLNLQQINNGPKPRRLGYYAMCLLVRYVAKHNYQDVVLEFGSDLWGNNHYFRGKIANLLGQRHAGIKAVIKEKFLSLSDSRESSLNDAFRRAEAILRLRDDIDPYDFFRNLDQDDVIKP